MKRSILVVDDEAAVLRQIEEAIERAIQSHHLFPAPHGGFPDAAQ